LACLAIIAAYALPYMRFRLLSSAMQAARRNWRSMPGTVAVHMACVLLLLAHVCPRGLTRFAQ
jgi:hypothetical protein